MQASSDLRETRVVAIIIIIVFYLRDREKDRWRAVIHCFLLKHLKQPKLKSGLESGIRNSVQLPPFGGRHPIPGTFTIAFQRKVEPGARAGHWTQGTLMWDIAMWHTSLQAHFSIEIFNVNFLLHNFIQLCLGLSCDFFRNLWQRTWRWEISSILETTIYILPNKVEGVSLCSKHQLKVKRSSSSWVPASTEWWSLRNDGFWRSSLLFRQPSAQITLWNKHFCFSTWFGHIHASQ